MVIIQSILGLLLSSSKMVKISLHWLDCWYFEVHHMSKEVDKFWLLVENFHHICFVSKQQTSEGKREVSYWSKWHPFLFALFHYMSQIFSSFPENFPSPKLWRNDDRLLKLKVAELTKPLISRHYYVPGIYDLSAHYRSSCLLFFSYNFLISLYEWLGKSRQ